MRFIIFITYCLLYIYSKFQNFKFLNKHLSKNSLGYLKSIIFGKIYFLKRNKLLLSKLTFNVNSKHIKSISISSAIIAIDSNNYSCLEITIKKPIIITTALSSIKITPVKSIILSINLLSIFTRKRKRSFHIKLVTKNNRFTIYNNYNYIDFAINSFNLIKCNKKNNLDINFEYKYGNDDIKLPFSHNINFKLKLLYGISKSDKKFIRGIEDLYFLLVLPTARFQINGTIHYKHLHFHDGIFDIELANLDEIIKFTELFFPISEEALETIKKIVLAEENVIFNNESAHPLIKFKVDFNENGVIIANNKLDNLKRI